MTANKMPIGDFIKLSRRNYQVILNLFGEIDNDPGLTAEENTVRDKIQQILINIQKFNANKKRSMAPGDKELLDSAIVRRQS